MQRLYKEQKANNAAHLPLYWNVLSFSFTVIEFSLDISFRVVMQHTSPLAKGRKRGDYLYRTGVKKKKNKNRTAFRGFGLNYFLRYYLLHSIDSLSFPRRKKGDGLQKDAVRHFGTRNTGNKPAFNAVGGGYSVGDKFYTRL